MSDNAVPSATGGSFSKWTIRIMAAIGVLGCLALIAIALMAFGITRGGGRYQPAKVEAADTREVFTVGNVDSIPRTNLIRLDVWAARSQGSSYSGGSRDDRRNIILFNTSTGASRRILPDNNRRIDELWLLPGDRTRSPVDQVEALADAATDAAAPPAWYVLLVDQPGEDDLGDLLVGSIATGNQAYVMTGIDGVDSIWSPDATHIAAIVRDKRKLFYRVIDMTTLKVSASRPIAID